MTEKQTNRKNAASTPKAPARTKRSTTVAEATVAAATTTSTTSRPKVTAKAAEAKAAPATTPKAPARAKRASKAPEVAASPAPADSAAAATEQPAATTPTREHMVAVAAYFRAQARGFPPGHDVEDWYAAEAEFSREPEPASAA